MQGLEMQVRVRIVSQESGAVLAENETSFGEPDNSAHTAMSGVIDETWNEFQHDRIRDQLARTVGAIIDPDGVAFGWPNVVGQVEYDGETRKATFQIDTPEALGVLVTVELPEDV